MDGHGSISDWSFTYIRHVRVTGCLKMYIEKCRKATKIRRLWEPEIGDCYYSEHFKRIEFIFEHDTPNFPWNIWLPRQDQLQDMIDWSLEDSCGFVRPNLIARIERFFTWVHQEKKRHIPNGICGQAMSITCGDDGMNRAFTSMEQLWLAFVMRENFSKKWTNGEWELCVISS